MKPIRRHFLILLLAVLAVGILLPATKLARTKRALRLFQAELVERGERFTQAAIVPKSDPVARRTGIEVSVALSRGRMFGNRTDLPSAMQTVAPGLARPASAFVASPGATNAQGGWPGLEQELAANNVRLGGIRAALARSPVVDFNVRYEQGYDLALTHLAPLRDVARLFSSSAVVLLRTGDCHAAVEEIRQLLTLIQALEGEVTLGSQQVRSTMAFIALAGTWDVLHAGGQSEADLECLQEAWAKLRFLGPMVRAIEMDRAMQRSLFERARSSPSQRRLVFQGLLNLGGPGPRAAPTFTTGAAATLSGLAEQATASLERSGELARIWTLETLWRSFWCYEDELHGLQVTQALLEGLRAADRGEPFAPLLRQMNAQLGNDRNTYRNAMRWLLSGQLIALPRVVQRSMVSVLQQDLARTAIALHRYRLRQGRWPDRLEDLVPTFLATTPRDVFDGGRLRYRLDASGRFLLYSVGEDGVDQGGDAKPPSSGPSTLWFYRGNDLVWFRAATPDEVEKAKKGGARPGL